jgi:hypothetical protein
VEEQEEEWPVRHQFAWHLGVPDGCLPAPQCRASTLERLGEEVAGTDPHNHVAAEMEILQMVLINRGTEEEVLSLEVLVTVLAIFKLGLDSREVSEDKLMLDLTIREGCLARRYSNAERATLL